MEEKDRIYKLCQLCDWLSIHADEFMGGHFCDFQLTLDNKGITCKYQDPNDPYILERGHWTLDSRSFRVGVYKVVVHLLSDPEMKSLDYYLIGSMEDEHFLDHIVKIIEKEYDEK